MQKVIIEKSHDFIDGGCNACPTVRCETYVLKDQGNIRVLELLDCQCLIQELAICSGYTLDYEMGMDQDVVTFKKSDHIIRSVERYGQLRYTNGIDERMIPNSSNSFVQMIPLVNRVLSEVFNLEEREFEERVMD